MRWVTWEFSLPKSNSDILRNFATTADFGQKGGKTKRTSSKQGRKAKMKGEDTREAASQSSYKERGTGKPIK